MFSFARRFLIVLAVLGSVRLALPAGVRAYVNRTIGDLEGYEGEIDDLDLNLWRGAYEIEGLTLRKAAGNPGEPFAKVRRIDLSVQWAALLHGKLAGEAICLHPTVSFVNVPRDEGAVPAEQTGAEVTWAERLDRLFPFDVNRFVVRDGEIRYRQEGDAPVDLYMTDLYVEALNISNVRRESEEQVLLSEVEAAGRPFGTGEFEARLRFDPLAHPLRFELDAALREIDVVNLNDFFAAYGDLDAESGSFSAYAEFAVSDGQIEGYVKPLFENLELVSFSELDSPAEALEVLWDGMVSVASQILTNQPTERLATRVVLRGQTDEAGADLFQIVGSLLRNAFIVALRPALDDTVELRDLEIVVEESGASGSGGRAAREVNR